MAELMCCAPMMMNSVSTISFTATMMLLARALSRTPSIRSHVIKATMANAGTLISIGMPATSKRPGMTFSNNVKIFVGAVPRCMYQLGAATTWRPRVHENLHASVAAIYQAVMAYAPFGLFIDGGTRMVEGQGETEWDRVFAGNDAVELDLHVLGLLGLARPEYLERLRSTTNAMA